jgi:two-component system response regulator PilR (NtrC family)
MFVALPAHVMNSKASILLVDDEPNIIAILEMALRDQGMDVLKAAAASDALDLLRQNDVDVVISDIRMPDMSGVELLKEAKQLVPDTVFILITAYASTDTAIDALQHGAYDYLTKPFKIEELLNIVRHSLEKKFLKHELASLKNEIEAQQGQKLFQALHRSQLVGKSQKMLEVYRTIGTVAMGESTVLVTGESGTGKELVARAIHEASKRKDRPFVSINCGAFPETLLESELFGYMKGAFTGAVGNKKGLLEAASGGSVFLDEIGDMTPAMQVKLLRALQEKKLRPLGGTQEVLVDVRVIVATNRDLKAAIQQGQFREDLYYRIAVITIHLPPLRERAEDIDLLAFHFLGQYAEKNGKRVFGISREALHCLENYHWPGNVRELENTIERAIALETTEAIQIERLPDAVRKLPMPAVRDSISLPEGCFSLDEFLRNFERDLICQVLKRTEGNQTLAAAYLQLTKPSLRHRIQVLGIDPSVFRRNGSTP